MTTTELAREHAYRKTERIAICVGAGVPSNEIDQMAEQEADEAIEKLERE